ncbi:hypothetical protein D9613_011954 [Agrocybe pediades]|uniref:Uncharacterized protein n=1 Tax=Agrocybe pediades TaxID=84607 RepID=A0A8H4QEV3_9AGAR|nr:hypothetical protein D9613_011954 [Agrocybe pediades]
MLGDAEGVWPITMYIVDDLGGVRDAGERREFGPSPLLPLLSSAVQDSWPFRGVPLPIHNVHVNFTRTLYAGMVAIGSWSSYWSISEQDTLDDDQGALTSSLNLDWCPIELTTQQ